MAGAITTVVLLLLLSIFGIFTAIYSTIAAAHHWQQLNDVCDPIRGFFMFYLIWTWLHVYGVLRAGNKNQDEESQFPPAVAVCLLGLYAAVNIAISVLYTVFYLNRDGDCSQLFKNEGLLNSAVIVQLVFSWASTALMLGLYITSQITCCVVGFDE
jgi:hypothetical protein